MFQIGLKKFLLLGKFKTLCHGHILLIIKTMKKSLGYFTKELQKANQKELRVGKVIKRKRSKLYFNWKGLDYSFSSWTDEKDIV